MNLRHPSCIAPFWRLNLHISLLGVIVLFCSSFSFERNYSPGEEKNELAEAINAYRIDKGLPAIHISSSLTLVAETHVADLQENPPNRSICNLHSWSKSPNWSACCYRDDLPKAECMWDKPREITRMRYKGNGYEIAAWLSDPITPEQAIKLWEKSKGHHDVIMNRGDWATVQWRAVGAAMSENYAVVWFGTEFD